MNKQKILKIINKLETTETDVDSYAEILRQGLDEIRGEVMKYNPRKVTDPRNLPESIRTRIELERNSPR